MARREDYDIVLRATDQTALAFASVKRGVESIEGAVGSLKTGLKAIGIAVGAAELASKVKENVSALAQIGDKAKTVGVTSDALQALRYQVRQSGGDFTDADTALQRFADSASKAGTGSNYLTKVFQANGIALKDNAGQLKDATTLLQDYARLVANATSQQDKVRLSVEAFGRQAGPQMVETLERIAKYGISGLIERSKELGVVADKELIDKAEVIDRKYKQLEDRFSTFFRTLSVGAAEGVGTLLDKLGDLATRLSTGLVGQGSTNAAKMLLFGKQFSPNQANDFYDAIFGRGAAPGKPTNLPNANDVLQKQIDSISRHIAAMEADAKTVDATAGAHEALRVRLQLLELAQQHGIPIVGEYADKLKDLENRARGAADALAIAKVQSDTAFDRAQLGRTASDQVAAEKLRSARIDATSATGQQIASEIRLNEALKDTKSLADDALKGMIADMRAGKNGAEVLAGVLDKILTKLSNLAIDNLLSSLFKPASATGGGLFAGTGKLFGFADGGEFRVGGVGGTDSQLVAFRASPDETVSVSTPSQRRGGQGQPIVISYAPSIDARGADSSAVARLAATLAQDKKNFVANVERAMISIGTRNPGVTR